MMETLAVPGRRLTEWILPLYRDTTFAYALATVMVLVAVLLCLLAIYVHSLRMAATRRRRRVLSSELTGLGTAAGGNLSQQELYFREEYDRISAVMTGADAYASHLVTAWRNYAKTFVRADSGPVVSPFRPRTFLIPATGGSGFLEFCANIFVAFGLLATFVGLVAALTFASTGMQTGDASQMQLAVRDLLGASASKFVTSIAGVGLSIVLRILDRSLTLREEKEVELLADGLESGLRIAPSPAAMQARQSVVSESLL